MLTNKIIHKLQIRLLREYGLKFTADAIGFLSIVAEQVNQRHGQHLRRLHIRRLLIRNDVVCTVERAGNAATHGCTQGMRWDTSPISVLPAE